MNSAANAAPSAPAAPPSIPDRHGQPVRAGDNVRILDLTLDPDLDDDDRDMFDFMIGAICDVERVDAEGQAWVVMWWNNVEGVLTTTVALTPDQFERVARQAASTAVAGSGRANR